MHKIFALSLAAGTLGIGAAAGYVASDGNIFSAQASSTTLLQGCTDVPEAVALADTLRLRGIAVDRAIADIDRRKQELAVAEQRVKTRLDALKKERLALADTRNSRSANTAEGIEHLISVYDAMKPTDAATILAALPADFAAEILTRVQPDTSARIIASIEPGQAAILTAHMGSRRISGD